MEELNILMSVIGNFGFPIACTVALFCMWNKEREEHKRESQQWQDAFNANTAILENLKDLIERRL